MIEQLIEKKDLRKYHLIKLLEMDPFLSKSKSFIKDEFKLSEYLLRVTIDRLIDFKKIAVNLGLQKNSKLLKTIALFL